MDNLNWLKSIARIGSIFFLPLAMSLYRLAGSPGLSTKLSEDQHTSTHKNQHMTNIGHDIWFHVSLLGSATVNFLVNRIISSKGFIKYENLVENEYLLFNVLAALGEVFYIDKIARLDQSTGEKHWAGGRVAMALIACSVSGVITFMGGALLDYRSYCEYER